MSDELPRAGTLVIRGGRVVYASEGVAHLAGRSAGAIVGRSPLELVVPEERPRVEALRARALRGEPVPRALELALVLPDGGRRPVECLIESDGVELLVHVRDLGAQVARRHRLEAIATAGVAIRSERSEEAVHARVRAELDALGLASGLLRAGEGGPRIDWLSVPEPLRGEFAARLGAVPEGYVGAWTEVAEKVRDEGAAFTDDWGVDVAAFLPREHREFARALVSRAGLARCIAVRLDGRDELTYLFVAGSWLRSDDVPALRLFAAQMSAALDAARTISDLSRQNARLAALNRVAELAGHASDLPAFFAQASEVVREAAGYTRLAIFVSDEPSASLVRVHAEGAPLPYAAAGSRVPAASRLGDVLRERVARVVSPPYAERDEDLARLLGCRTLAGVPLVARSRPVGVLLAGFEGDEPPSGAVELLAAIGAHFASAIESHGLLSDLRRRVDELTLLNDVAQAAAHLDPVVLLEAAIRRIRETLGTRWAAAYVRDGERLLLLAAAGLDAQGCRAIAELPAAKGVTGLALSRVVPALVEANELFGDRARAGVAPPGPVLAVPLAAKSRAVGALLLGREAPAALTAGEGSLLSSIGVQLGVAVDAARLFADVRRRLADLETVHALALRVFEDAPGDVRALLVGGAAGLARALSARGATVLLADADGATLRVQASVGEPVLPDGAAIELSRDALAAGVMRRRVPAVSDDLTRDRRCSLAARADLPPTAAVALPLASRDAVRGVVLVLDAAGRTFSAADVALANALVGLLGLGLENARLYDEARHRAQELGLLHEVGRSLVQTLDFEQVLRDGIRNLARIVGAPAAYLALVTPDAAHLEIRAAAGAAGGTVGDRVPLAGARADAGLAARVFERREPLLVEDAADDPRARQEVRRTPGARAYLALPLVVRDRTIGSAVIVETRGPRLFTPAEVERGAAVANQLAVAADNARLYEDLRRSYAQLARAQEQLIEGERLAALGELAAIVAHEVRNPLGVIFNSLGSLRRLVRPAGDARMLFDIVGEEAERLNRIVGDLLDFARPSTPELRPEVLGRLVEDTVGAAATQNARVELVRELDPLLPPVLMDARLVRQAVLNVAVNAVQAMPRGGRVTIRTRRDGDTALVEIEDTGAGIAEEVRARIFEPFFTTKASGTGLGLAVVKRIVEGHGGRVSVRAGAGGGTVFALAFPLAGPPVENAPAMG